LRTKSQVANQLRPAADAINPDDLPPPMRALYERCCEPETARHQPSGHGAHIYVRVSSDEQAGPGKTSLDEQIRLSRKALPSDIPIVAIWQDEGFSGASRLADRPVGRQLLAAVQPGEIVVVYRLDRFSRDTLLGLLDLRELRQRGVGLYIAAEHRWVPPADGGLLDPVAEFNLHQGIVAAQLERDMVVSRTEAGRRAKIRLGYYPYGNPPYGYKKVHDGIGFRLVPDEYRQRVLAFMRRSHERGASCPQISAALNQAGFRNSLGNTFEESAVYATMRKQGILVPRSRPGNGAKSSRVKPSGNPAIAAESPAGVSAKEKQKIERAERVRPTIVHLIAVQGCRTYRQVADALNCLEVPAARGGNWHQQSVKNTMAVLNLTFDNVRQAAARDLKVVPGELPRRASRSERQKLCKRYDLPTRRRGSVQKATPDILFMRDRGSSAEQISRMLCVSLKAVKQVIKQYPPWKLDDPVLVDRILAAHASGEDARKIAHAVGLDVKTVRRVIGVPERLVKYPRKRQPPLAEDRRAAILALRREGKTGAEIYAELGVRTERERQQIRRFLRQQARQQPALALRSPPFLNDEIAAAKHEAKPPEDAVRQDLFYLTDYWEKKWEEPQSPQVELAVKLLGEGLPIVEVVARTELLRGRVKYLAAALRDGRMGLKRKVG
jgi:DNA invertase Pin-like site-specific DNA recombinase